ncbi:MAG: asparagine synthase (glutamine-hydrolyzing) [Candidatus Latescibacterota bacterium]|nr:MAG: asparagine synthase (glutamine-hydrolyzing) [Candidatus Latescibacterota bacterium]
MCGIAGVVNAGGAPAQTAILEQMRDTMAHRGPDDVGIHVDGSVGLGHRRLSIIDIEGGHQPMGNPEGTVWVVHNGEIYNFRELRRELEQDGISFRTRSDTEVILAAYEKWGVDCLERLNGIFAFGIWDKTNNQLFLARDRLGIKPLYYAPTPSALLFASELKAFLEVPTFDRRVDPAAVDQYFAFGYIPAPATIFRAAKKLLPAHYLLWREGDFRVERYWRFEPHSDRNDRGIASWTDELRDVLRGAVKRQMVSDVPLGAFLSGGIDSSLIVRMMSETTSDPIRTFTIGFGGCGLDETPYADIVAKKFDTVHHEHDVTPETVDVLPKLVWHLDEPFADSSLLPTYYVSKITRQEVTVALSGDGGDELFAGYTRHQGEKLSMRFRRLPSWVRSNLVSTLNGPVVRGVPKLRRLGQVFANAQLDFGDRYRNKESLSQVVDRADLYSDEFGLEVGGGENIALLRELANVTSNSDYIERLTVFDLEFYLPNDMLTKVDKMSMASALEVRVPFLDETVMDVAARVPSKLKLRGFTTKYLLRRLASEVLPGEIWKRGKQGFSVPLESWFRGQLVDYARDVLLDSRTVSRGYLKRSALENLLIEHETGKLAHGRLIFGLITFELWNRVFVDNGGA